MPTIYADDINYLTTRIKVCAKLLDGYVEVSYDIDPDDKMVRINNEHDFIDNYVRCGYIKRSKFFEIRQSLGLPCNNV